MAAKRLPQNDDEQDFGFLNADGDAGVDDAGVAEATVADAGLSDAGEAGLPVETLETSIAPSPIPTSDVFQPSAAIFESDIASTPVASPASDAGELASSIPALDIGSIPFVSPASEAHESDDSVSAPDIDITPVAAPANEVCDSVGSASAPNIAVVHPVSTDSVSHKLFAGVAGYAIALTLLFLGLLLTGRMSLFGNHTLESLPDLRPLAPNEFRRVPDGAELPEGHVLRLGESRRFGDVVITPVKVTKEPLQFQGFLSGAIEEQLTTAPVLKLWLTFKNVADDYAFPPFDAGLMSNRMPADSQESATLANSFLTIDIPSGDFSTTRRLNFLHSMDNNFIIVGQESAKSLLPGESLTTFIASSDEEGEINAEDSTSFVWRVHFRKGVNLSGGNGVTTMIDVKFSGADVATSG